MIINLKQKIIEEIDKFDVESRKTQPKIFEAINKKHLMK